MGFRLAWRTRSVMLTVPAWPECGFRKGAARLRPLAKRHCAWSDMKAAFCLMSESATMSGSGRE